MRSTNPQDIRFYEVEISFLAPTGAVVPITASSEAEARQIAEHLFRDHTNLQVVKVNSIESNPETQPTLPLLN